MAAKKITPARKTTPKKISSPKTTTIKTKMLAVLNTVIDPEIGAGIVDIGLIYNIDIKGKTAFIQMTLTSFGCPIGPWFVEQVRDAALSINHIDNAEVEIVYEPAWTPEKMKPEIREAILGY